MSETVVKPVEILSADSILKPNIEQSYKEIIVADQEQNKSRANQLAILPEEARKNIVLASQYSSHFPNPITKPFMRKYILAKLEFPTKGSELAQSLTELNVRIDNLFNDAYTYRKAELEAEELDIQMQELQEKLLDAQPGLSRRKLEIQIEKIKLEQQNKGYSLNKIKLTAMARYNEAMGWKGCVEEVMNEMGVTAIEDVNFNEIRMEEMAAKIKRWGQLHAQGALELTPSKFQAIDSNQEAFADGVQETHVLQLEHKQRQEDARKQLENAQRVLGIGRKQ